MEATILGCIGIKGLYCSAVQKMDGKTNNNWNWAQTSSAYLSQYIMYGPLDDILMS